MEGSSHNDLAARKEGIRDDSLRLMGGQDPRVQSSARVLGMRVDATSYPKAVEAILGWARGKESRMVCEAPVHMVMETRADAAYARAIESADLVTPGGMPVVWMLRLLGCRRQGRVYGPELMLRTCAAAAAEGVPVGLYGSTPAVVAALQEALTRRFPGLKIVFVEAPPFRPVTASEDATTVAALERSGCRILFVGLGCPRQEQWIARQRGRVSAVMFGVGAAFDFISGNKPQAPAFLQRLGLEWVFRFFTEPRRLWYRYAYHNPRFVALAACQWIKHLLFAPTDIFAKETSLP